MRIFFFPCNVKLCCRTEHHGICIGFLLLSQIKSFNYYLTLQTFCNSSHFLIFLLNLISSFFLLTFFLSFLQYTISPLYNPYNSYQNIRFCFIVWPILSGYIVQEPSFITCPLTQHRISCLFFLSDVSFQLFFSLPGPISEGSLASARWATAAATAATTSTTATAVSTIQTVQLSQSVPADLWVSTK